MTTSQSSALGRYELVAKLADGAWSTVYTAHNRATGELVALKKLKSLGALALQHFKREFRTVQGVHHPNVVELRELFEADGSCFIAMELVEGRDLLAALRAAPGEGSVRDVFVQLTLALVTLHAAGVVHRDVKPSNVRVTPQGRVVLLDFGLVKTEQSEREGIAGIGTAAYMAPEQAAGDPVGPAADFYALGACLYEALTGVKPIVASSAFALMQVKRSVQPPPPSARTHGVPPDLGELCMQLLAIEPDERPGPAEILRVLQLRAPIASTMLPASTASEQFTGREPELAALTEAHALARQGAFRVVLIEGESGIGKSRLVAEFARRVAAQAERGLWLRSRCYENELLAFKAFDGAMEQLARALSEMDQQARNRLLPEHAAVLSRLFGAFGAVPDINDIRSRALPAEPAAQRLAGFQALAQLLAKLARERAVVLEVDDLQWADAESVRLLHELQQSPERPALLIVATVRPSAELSDEAARWLALLRGWSCTSHLALVGLARDAAGRLARELLGPQSAAPLVEALVEESRGHPLLLAELVRYAQRSGSQPGQPITLMDALRARIDALSPEAEQLLSAAAVAGRPYVARVLATATRASAAEFNLRASELLGDRLLRRRRGHELACFHDQIRAVAFARLSPERQRELHASLAHALAQQPGADPSERARHHDAAGQREQAIVAYASAAELALESLAFARAEQLCARALTLARGLTVAAPTLHALELTRGHALARGGRSAEAAEQYRRVADSTQGEERTRLRIWSAQHLLQSAHVAEGMAAARALLSELGVGVPAHPAATVARLLWDRAALRLQGLELEPNANPSAPRTRMQLDALWGLAMPIAWLEPLTSAALSARHMRLAHALADATHMARALAEHAAARALRDAGDPSADQLLQRARALTERCADPTLEVCVAFREATVASTRWDLPLATARLEHAHRVATEQCPDQPWLLTNVRIALGSNMMLVGEHAALAGRSTRWLAEARNRNDRFALALLQGLGSGTFVELMADRPERALAELESALAHWPREPFAFTHYGELIAVSQIELYRGGTGLHAWLERERARLERATLLRLPFFKTTLLLARIWACLSARANATPGEAADLLRRATEQRDALRSLKVRVAVIQGHTLDAQLAALAGDGDGALASASSARAQAELSGYGLLRLSLDYLISVLEGGEAGAAGKHSVLAALRAQGWREPRRAPALLCPAIDELEARG